MPTTMFSKIQTQGAMTIYLKAAILKFHEELESSSISITSNGTRTYSPYEIKVVANECGLVDFVKTQAELIASKSMKKALSSLEDEHVADARQHFKNAIYIVSGFDLESKLHEYYNIMFSACFDKATQQHGLDSPFHKMLTYLTIHIYKKRFAVEPKLTHPSNLPANNLND